MSRPRTFQPYDEEDDKFQQSVMDLFRLKLQNLLSKKDEKNFSFTLTPFSKADSVEGMIKEVEQIILGTYNFEDWFEKRYPNELELLDKIVHQNEEMTEEDFDNIIDKNKIYQAFRNKASHHVSQIFSSHIYTKEILQNLLVHFSPETLTDKIKNIDKSDTTEELGELKYRIYKL